jgi:hypothetical protein
MKQARCEICGRKIERPANLCNRCADEICGEEIDVSTPIDPKDDPFRPGARLEGWFRRPN